jgi:Cof subfamily protein (haloacid dehalogenase superfamily)
MLGWLRRFTKRLGLLGRRGEPTIRLIALDLDGTLLDSRKRISGRTVRALKALPEQGVRVVLASARPPRSCKAIYDGLGLDTWQINYNGALVWDPRTQRSVYHWPMPGELVYEQVKLGREIVKNVQVAVEIVDRWYTDRHDPYRTTVTGRMFKPDVVAPVNHWARLSATKLMFLAEPRRVARIREALREQYGHLVKVVHADPDLVQVMSNQAGKDVALRLVAQHYGIPIEETLGVGDALNDVDMLKASGVAVCVANGCDEAKAISHWIAPSNDEHGVYEAIRRYVPGLAELNGSGAE